jgi:hypothetical protein
MLVVSAAVSVLSWRYGPGWVRRKQRPGLIAVGVYVLVVAPASNLAAYQLFVVLPFG